MTVILQVGLANTVSWEGYVRIIDPVEEIGFTGVKFIIKSVAVLERTVAGSKLLVTISPGTVLVKILGLVAVSKNMTFEVKESVS